MPFLNYPLMMDTLEEIRTTTHDEYGLKAGGFLHSQEKFNTLFGLRHAHTLFGAAEQVSLALQKRNISIQNALSAVDAAKAYYHRLWLGEEFNCSYDATVKIAEQHQIGLPELPRYRRRLSRFEDGGRSHEYPSAKAYYRYTYFEACDLSAELADRFENQHILSMLAIEHTLLNAANGKMNLESCYKNDIDWSD